VDGDGYADVVVGAPRAGADHRGAAFVFSGAADGVADASASDAATRLIGDQADGFLGVSVAGAADVDGDGFADVLAGAEGTDAGAATWGAAFVFGGKAGGFARPVRARQLRGDGSGAPVAPWGGTGAAGFAVRLAAHPPQGTGRVRLEAEACPSGVAFDTPQCT